MEGLVSEKKLILRGYVSDITALCDLYLLLTGL